MTGWCVSGQKRCKHDKVHIVDAPIRGASPRGWLLIRRFFPNPRVAIEISLISQEL